ncbi:MAG TPA: ABC transporter, partial [Glaciihabitans sp.]|nr:ABC transporter [Glaciihabitans sp.]
DPLIDAVFRSYVQRVREAGSSVLLSSHLLTEVEHLCERVTIIRQGTVVETGSLAELRHLTRTTFRLTTDRDTAVLAALPAVHNLRTTDGVLEFDVDADGLEAALRITSTLQPAQLSVGPPSLESLFMQYYKEQPTASSP